MIYLPCYFWFYPNDYVVDEAAHQRELARLAAMPIYKQVLIGDGKTQEFKLKYESRGWTQLHWEYDGNEYEVVENPDNSQLVTITPTLPSSKWLSIKYRYAR